MKGEAIQELEQGGFCKQCNNEVFDLRDSSLEEVSMLQKKYGKICGVVPVLTAAAMIAGTSCSNEAPSSERFSGKPEMNFFKGEVCAGLVIDDLEGKDQGN